MKNTLYKYVLVWCILQHTGFLSSISMVYNFRIAQITKQPIHPEQEAKSHIFVTLLFDQFRKKYNGTFQNFAGGLGSFIYNFFESYYCRVDFAASNIHERAHDITTFSGTQTDDILFTVGHNVIKNDRTIMTISGLFGVPTHKIEKLLHVDFGYSQIGIGVQLDGSYTLNQKSALLYGGRYIYFVPRKARDPFEQQHTFTLGNVGDILLAYKNNWSIKHGIEFGYTLRSRFGAAVHPHFDDTIKKSKYLRSNFYGVYKYRFSLKKTSNRLLFYAAYGHDHKPKIFGHKYIITLWTSWNISF